MSTQCLRVDASALPFTFQHQVAVVIGEGRHKELNAIVTIMEAGAAVWYEVREHRSLVRGTSDFREAARAYNEL